MNSNNLALSQPYYQILKFTLRMPIISDKKLSMSSIECALTSTGNCWRRAAIAPRFLRLISVDLSSFQTFTE